MTGMPRIVAVFFPFGSRALKEAQTANHTALGEAEGEPVRNLFFAGEHCSPDFQGFMEGGCETVETAARAIVASRGVTISRHEKKALEAYAFQGRSRRVDIRTGASAPHSP
ncbi:MAG TPA: FAD-dependent oxidoreductase [Thermoanaerobaculia bacterium]|nr:FAD-dependent oxidoreductase [Thermoanaerobaculia bacterium]